jgi:signal peptidase II
MDIPIYRALHHPKWLLSGSALALSLVDQGTKWVAKAWLLPDHPFPLIPHVFQLTLAYNTGAAFSLLSQKPQLLTGFTTLLFLILIIYSLSRPRYVKLEIPALALLLGGAFGNLLDRILFGHVTDFFDFVIIRYPVFNVADAFIFCGALLLIRAHWATPQTADYTSTTPAPTSKQADDG